MVSLYGSMVSLHGSMLNLRGYKVDLQGSKMNPSMALLRASTAPGFSLLCGCGSGF
jgi:hypothetical protein